MRREKKHTSPAGQTISAQGRNRLELVFLEAWRPYAWIAGVIVALYGITLSFPFVFDDIQLVKDNFVLLGDFKNILKAFTLDVFWKTPGSYYRPALTVSLMIDALLGGQHPAWYHATNILLHCACAAAVLRLLLRLACPRPLAFVLGMVFAVHPVMVQAVAWVAGRNDLLMTLFAVASLLTFLSFAQEGKWRYLVSSSALLLLAVLSKESAVALPLLMMGYILFVAGRRPAPRALIAAAAGQALVIAAYLLLRRNALGSGFSPHEFNSVAENCVGLFGYIGKLLFPFGLSTLPAPESVSPIWGPLAAALIIVLFLAGRVVNRRLFLFGCGWFVIFLIPTVARITPFANFLEHRLYLPLVGCLMMLAVSRWLRNLDRKSVV
jgi:protein O-mannosyl-transferase